MILAADCTQFLCRKELADLSDHFKELT